MPTPYAPVPTRLPASLTLPQDLIDQRTAASVNQVFQPLGDGVEFDSLRLDQLASLTALKAILVPTNGLVRNVVGYGIYVFLTAATYGQEPYFCAATDLTPGRWVSEHAYSRVSSATGSGASPPSVYRTVNAGRPLPGASAVVTITSNPALSTVIPSAALLVGRGFLQFLTVVTGSGASGTHVVYDITDALIDKCTLFSVDVTITPNAAHVGLPQLMPTGYIMRTHALTGVAANLRSGGPFVDTSLLAAYNVLHEIGGPCDQNNLIDLSLYNYSLVFTNEGGTNSLANMMINGIRCWMGDA